MLQKIGGVLMASAFLLACGCSIRMQAPIRAVAYDFSDHDFYDRAYAPSPAYAVDATPRGAPHAMAPAGRGHESGARAHANARAGAEGAADDDTETEELTAPVR